MNLYVICFKQPHEHGGVENLGLDHFPTGDLLCGNAPRLGTRGQEPDSFSLEYQVGTLWRGIWGDKRRTHKALAPGQWGRGRGGHEGVCPVLYTRLSSVTEGLWEAKSHPYKVHTYSASTITKAQLSGDTAPHGVEAANHCSGRHA